MQRMQQSQRNHTNNNYHHFEDTQQEHEQEADYFHKDNHQHKKTGAKKDATNTNNSAKSSLFQYWSIICLIGNIFQIFASAISISNTNNISSGTEILVGFGCMLAFINIGRYIEYSENYSTIYLTISGALPNVMRYLIGVMPIFLGFIFFGLCIFWRSERFTSTSDIMIILFALAQGDSVFDTFKDLSGLSFFLGQVYLYLFCIIFIVVVLNIFIAIIEEAYIITKMENKTHWVYDYMKKDPNEIIAVKEPTSRTLPKIEDRKDMSSRSYKSSSELLKKSNKQVIPTSTRHFGHEPTSLETGILRSRRAEDTSKTPPHHVSYEKLIDEEFFAIEMNLDEIRQASLELISSKDHVLKDEVRTMIFDQINSIERKTQQIRNVLNKN